MKVPLCFVESPALLRGKSRFAPWKAAERLVLKRAQAFAKGVF